MNNASILKNDKGMALILITAIFSTLFILVGTSLNRGSAEYSLIQRNYLNDIAFNLAEAGIEKAFYELSKPASTYEGETNTSLGKGTFSVQLRRSDSSNHVEVIAIGVMQSAQSGLIEKKVRAILQIEDKDSTRKVTIQSISSF
jgi:hypothetical protein